MKINYHAQRFELFKQSYCGVKMTDFLRKKYSIHSQMSFQDFFKRINPKVTAKIDMGLSIIDKIFGERYPRWKAYFMAFGDEAEALTPEITKLSRILRINQDVLRLYILFNYTPSNIPPPDIVYLITDGFPLSEFGYYIRVDQDTTISEVEQAYAIIQNRISSSTQKFGLVNKIIAGVESIFPQKRIKKRKEVVAPDDKRKIKVSIAIEQEMLAIEKEKSKSKDREQYKNELVRPAIEHIVGNELADIEDDNKFEDKFKQRVTLYDTWHTSIFARYQLPSFRKLSPILRDICS